jgi:hypothetical protein
MVDFDAQQPVRAIATEFTTEVANAAGTTINPVEEFPQASTTSGQYGPLDQAAVTAITPSYLDGTTSPLSLDLAGNLRVTPSPTSLQNVNITEIGGNAVTTTLPVSGTVTALQGTTPWTVDGTVTANIGTTGGLALDATLTNGSQHTIVDSGTITVTQATGTNLHTVVDNFPAFPPDADALAQGSSTPGQLGALEMGATTTAAPSYANGTTNPLSLDTAGNLRVSSTVTNFPALQNINLTEIGGNAITTTVPVSGTVTALQGTSPWVVSGAVTTSPDVNVHDGSGNTIASTGTSLNVDVTNTIPVTGTFWQAIQPVSGTVAISNFPATVAVTQSTSPWVVSGTVTANLGTIDGAASAANQTLEITDLGTIISNQTNGTQHTIVDNFPADADALAQGSLTSGQLGALVMGAVTTAAPVYTTATTNPLSIDTAGNLRTAATISFPPAVLTYFTDVAVASNASTTHSVAGPTNLDAIWGSGSGEIKLTVAIGPTGSEVIKFNGFTSASNQTLEFDLKNTYVVPVGSSIKVTIQNRDNKAQDLYFTFVTH